MAAAFDAAAGQQGRRMMKSKQVTMTSKEIRRLVWHSMGVGLLVGTFAGWALRSAFSGCWVMVS
jgi:hypothetical protein